MTLRFYLMTNNFQFVNVAEGGITESAYTIRNPDIDLPGSYACLAQNNFGSDRFTFRVYIK